MLLAAVPEVNEKGTGALQSAARLYCMLYVAPSHKLCFGVKVSPPKPANFGQLKNFQFNKGRSPLELGLHLGHKCGLATAPASLPPSPTQVT
jgi:hypothetical protein